MIIPSAVTQEEKDFLASLATGKLVYEAGALLGSSTIALALGFVPREFTSG